MLNKQEAHGPHRSPEKTVQINKHICLYHKVDKKKHYLVNENLWPGFKHPSSAGEANVLPLSHCQMKCLWVTQTFAPLIHIKSTLFTFVLFTFIRVL